MKLRATWETGPVGRASKIVYVTSIPYAIDKSDLVARIGDIVLGRKLPPLLDVRDVSTDDVRIELELKKDADEKMVLAYLFKHTPLQTNFNVNLTCLIPTEQAEVGRPERLDLKAMLWHFLHFRLEVVTARLEHELAALSRRQHLLEGFAKIFDALDEILRIVRKSEGKADAARQIIARFGLDAEQTDAILELKIYRLARLEIQVIQEELAAARKRARELRGALGDEAARWAMVREEIEAVRTADPSIGKDARRTTFAAAEAEVEYSAEDFIVDEDGLALLSRDGWIKRQKDVKDLATTRLREGDAVMAVVAGSTRATAVFFTNYGTAYTCRFIDIPASTGYGEPIQRLFKFKDGERVVAAFSLDPRLAGAIAAPSPEDPPPVHAVAVTSDGYSLRFSLAPFVEPSTRAGRRYARTADGAEVVGRGADDRPRDLDHRDAPGAGHALPGRRGELPVRARARRHPDQDRPRGGSRPGLHRLGRRPRPAARRDQPRRRADRQHRQVRGHRARRPGPRTAPARPVHPGDSRPCRTSPTLPE